MFTQSAILPYLYRANRTNYYRWLPVYILDMLHMYTPDAVKDAFKTGQFTFRGILDDLMIDGPPWESRILSSGTQEWWVLCWPNTSTISTYTYLTHHELDGVCQAAVTTTRGVNVNDLMKKSQNNMTDPFNTDSHPEVLLNITTGVYASVNVHRSLVAIKETGEKHLEKFMNSALKMNTSRSFYCPITRSNWTQTGELNIDVHSNVIRYVQRNSVLQSMLSDMFADTYVSQLIHRFNETDVLF